MSILKVFEPNVLIPWILAMFFGVFVGATPGLTATMAVALIIPLTYYMNPTAALAMIFGVVFTAIFAGDIPATYLRIPGTPASGAATLDGFEMGKKGKASLALAIDLVCSAIGGLIGVSLLIMIAPSLASFALRFTNFEYFWLGVFGLSMSALLSRGNLVHGTISASLGVLVSTVGMDIVTGYPRFTFGNINLLGGISFIPAMIGLFGISEVLKQVSNEKSIMMSANIERSQVPLLKVLPIIWRNKWIVLKSSLIGTAIGSLPGAGADIAAWVAYGVEKRTSKRTKKFGTGIEEGVVAPTSANNAAIGGTWIPALVFGVPGDSVTAIVLGAMLMYGLKPGPLIFKQSGNIINNIFTVALISQAFLVVIGYLGIKSYGMLLRIPKNIILTAVILFSMIGSYAINSSFFNIYVMLFFGIIGYFFEIVNVPLAPMILGIILGPMVERNLRVGLIKTGGNFTPFLTRPISAGFVVLIVLILFGGNIFKLFKKVFHRK